MTVEELKIERLFGKCCGCGACAAVCPVGAIEMSYGPDGFTYPAVDHDKCLSCHRCEGICPSINVRSLDSVTCTYWAHDLLEERLKACSSGGVFGSLARIVLSKGGAVCGAVFDRDYRAVKHAVIDGEDGLSPMLRSKYVQSSISPTVYREIKDRLSSGQFVLFSGTACQVAAIRGYLGKLATSSRFVTVDVICHGVPSPGVWSKWIEYKKEALGGMVRDVSFRCKDNGWRDYSVIIEAVADDGTKRCYRAPFTSDWYMKAFLSDASLRSSCCQCPSKRKCGSDITLGDFWGVEDCHPEALDDYGVSAVVCNTDKGSELFDLVAGGLSYGACEYGEILAGNPSLEKSSIPFNRRDDFFNDVLSDESMDAICSRWSFKDSLGRRFASKVRRLTGALVKRIKQ